MYQPWVWAVIVCVELITRRNVVFCSSSNTREPLPARSELVCDGESRPSSGARRLRRLSDHMSPFSHDAIPREAPPYPLPPPFPDDRAQTDSNSYLTLKEQLLLEDSMFYDSDWNLKVCACVRVCVCVCAIFPSSLLTSSPISPSSLPTSSPLPILTPHMPPYSNPHSLHPHAPISLSSLLTSSPISFYPGRITT